MEKIIILLMLSVLLFGCASEQNNSVTEQNIYPNLNHTLRIKQDNGSIEEIIIKDGSSVGLRPHMIIQWG